MRLIGTNYTQDLATVITQSSQNPNFKASNIQKEHRSKEWRSSGNFTIDATNKTIVINSITYNLTEGAYTVSALKAAINAFDAGTQAGYNENTCLWTITTAVTVTGSLLPVLGYIVTSFSTTTTAPKAAIHTDEWIKFDFKTTEEINSAVILWGKGLYSLTSEAEIRIQASATSNFATTAVDELLTFNNDYEIASHYFTESQSYRYWRVVIKDAANVNGYVNLGVVILGQSEAVDNPDNGFTFTQVDTSNITTTDFGNSYVDEFPIMNRIELAFNIMDFSIALAFLNLYKLTGIKKCVFVTIDESDLVQGKDTFAIYGRFSNGMTHTHINYDIFSTGISINECN